MDTKEGKVVAIQADKKDYRDIAGMLQNFTGLPIQVSAKEAHFLNGFKHQGHGRRTKIALVRPYDHLGDYRAVEAHLRIDGLTLVS